MRRQRSSNGVSRFRAKKLDFSMFKGISSPTRSSILGRFLSPAKPNLELQLSTPTEAVDSPPSQPRTYAEGDFNGTPKYRKQCGCKQTKCLKLYCECFASGIYCNGCKCVDCHNNIENESARHAAVEYILERKRSTSRPNIINSPPITQVSPIPALAKQKRGCQCKKTCCLKGYCECFQANLLCSENCKCLDCKNYEGSEEKLALSPMDKLNTETCVRKADIAAFAALQTFGSNANNTPTQACRVNPLITSDAPSALSFHPLGYRSMLADVISPDSIRHFCSKLVAALNARKISAVTMLGHQDHNENDYREQERLVLINFRDFLKKIIACGNMRAGSSRFGKGERIGSRNLKRKPDHPHFKCTMFR